MCIEDMYLSLRDIFRGKQRREAADGEVLQFK